LYTLIFLAAAAIPLLAGSLNLESRRLVTEATEAYKAGKYSESERLNRLAIERHSSAQAEQDVEYAAALSNLGLSIYAQHRLHEAEGYLERALGIQEKLLGRHDPAITLTLTNLALVKRAMGEFLDARATLSRALEIKRRNKDDGTLSPTLHNLAAVYYELGQYSRSEKLFREALEAARREPASDAISRAATQCFLARFEIRKGKLKEAEGLIEDALDTRTRVLGAAHPKTAQTLNDLAEVHSLLGRRSEAEDEFQRSIAALEERLGPDSGTLTEPLLRFAGHYHRGGVFARAEPLYERVIAITEKAEGSFSLRLAGALSQYAALLRETKRKRESAALEDRAQTIREQYPASKENGHSIDVSAFQGKAGL
jgi:tetratricopeptide (TPR) repeat protein